LFCGLVYSLQASVANDFCNAAEGLSNIDWTVYGKIKQINKTTGLGIVYGYDAGGNCTTKKVSGDAGTTTYHARDTQGNVLAIYSKKGTDGLQWNRS
jgi:hypothetical protein